MHGRGKTAAAPASDSATRERRRCLRVGAASSFFFFFLDSRRLGTDSGRFALNRADSGRIGRNRQFRPKFKDFSGPYQSVTHCSSSSSSSCFSSSLLLRPLLCFVFLSEFFLFFPVFFGRVLFILIRTT